MIKVENWGWSWEFSKKPLLNAKLKRARENLGFELKVFITKIIPRVSPDLKERG
jgi:hypothetical protein